MKILKERKEVNVIMDVDFSGEERKLLKDYALKNIEKDEDALINWAFVDILENSIKSGTLPGKNKKTKPKKLNSSKKAKSSNGKK